MVSVKTMSSGSPQTCKECWEIRRRVFGAPKILYTAELTVLTYLYTFKESIVFGQNLKAPLCNVLLAYQDVNLHYMKYFS